MNLFQDKTFLFSLKVSRIHIVNLDPGSQGKPAERYFLLKIKFPLEEKETFMVVPETVPVRFCSLSFSNFPLVFIVPLLNVYG